MDNCCNKNSKNFKTIGESLDVLKAVTEPNRVRVLCILSKDDVCVCALAKRLDITRNLISHHLKVLHKVGILDKQRNGNQIFYSIEKSWKSKIKHLFKFLDVN